jgi:hypothetical protein
LAFWNWLVRLPSSTVSSHWPIPSSLLPRLVPLLVGSPTCREHSRAPGFCQLYEPALCRPIAAVDISPRVEKALHPSLVALLLAEPNPTRLTNHNGIRTVDTPVLLVLRQAD